MDVVRNRSRSDEAQGLHVRMLDQRVHRDLVTLDHVEDTVGQTCFCQQLRHEQCRRRIALARLQDERIAGRDGDGEHPARHHAREVERRDSGDDAQRLAKSPVVDAGADLVGVVALQQLWNAACELDDVDAACHLSLGVSEHLPVLGRDHPRQRVAMAVHQLQERVEGPRASDWRGLGPGGKGRLGTGDRAGYLFSARESDLAGNGTGRRVIDRLAAPTGTGDLAVVDVVTHFVGGRKNFVRAHRGLLRRFSEQLERTSQ